MNHTNDKCCASRLISLMPLLWLAFATQARGADLDRDGLDDHREDTLAARFAPILYLHDDEEFYPATPEWYMARVHMRYDHDNCFDHQILDLGEVSNASIGQQSHRNTNLICSHSGDSIWSSGGSGVRRFFLQIPNDSNETATRRGIRNPTHWICYANVRRADAWFGHVDVQYWFFYARNGNLGDLGGAHEGDWEHITVRVGPDDHTIQAIYYAAHEGEGIWYFPGEFALEDGRPRVYSALDSHASYPVIGQHPRETWPDDETNAGLRRDLFGAVSRLGTPTHPANGHLWLNYNGRWGEIGSVFSGPPGPAFQGAYWHEEVDNNPPPDDHHFAERDGDGCTISIDPFPPVNFPDGLGTYDCPWATLDIGLEGVPTGHMLRLHGDTYSAAGLTISRRMTITNYGGSAVVLR